MKITKLISAIIIITVAFSRGATFNVTDVSSFQAALTTAGANGEADIINVAAGIYNIATPLSYGGEYSLSIIGAGANSTILDGGRSVQIMNIDSSAEGDIFVTGFTFRNGSNYVTAASKLINLSPAVLRNCYLTAVRHFYFDVFISHIPTEIPAYTVTAENVR